MKLETQTNEKLQNLGFNYADICILSLEESLEQLEKRTYELANPKQPIDLKTSSKVAVRKYLTDINLHLSTKMEYDLPTIVKMPVADRLCVLEINKQDRALNAQEELDDLTSYETESIKSETEYQIEL